MSHLFKSISPVDGETLWQGRSADHQEIRHCMAKAAKAAEAWRRTTVEERVEVVRCYGARLSEHRDEIADLISREVGKLGWDADGEVAASIAKIETSILAKVQRRSDGLVDAGKAVTAAVQRRIRYRPLGVTLILGPFNFPLHLPGGQIIPALLAGNAVVFKPSEEAMAVAHWMADAWHHAGLPRDVLQLIPGAVEAGKMAIEAPEVSAVFLTGGREAGKAIHRQLAGRPEVLLALELGGNNPILVMDSVDPAIASRLVSFSAFISSGQRCTCARRALFVEGARTDAQIDELVTRTAKLRVGMPNDSPTPQIGPLVSSLAVSRLFETYDRLINLGCKPLLPLETVAPLDTLVRPAILDGSDISAEASAKMTQMEWFGPILIVQREPDFDAAVDAAASTPYGLSAALLGGTGAMFEQFADRVGAGVVNWNSPTTGAAGTLPFGGLGASGNHRPAGYYAIDFCSDPVASLEQPTPVVADPWDVAE